MAGGAMVGMLVGGRFE